MSLSWVIASVDRMYGQSYAEMHRPEHRMLWPADVIPDSKVHGANMGPIWGRQDPGGPHIGTMNLAIRDAKGLL